MKRALCVFALAAAWAFGALPVRGQAVDFSPEMRGLLSRLESMGQGYHSQAEWDALFQHMNGLVEQARQAGNPDLVVELNAIKAMVYADMLKQYDQALGLLQQTKQQYGAMKLPGMKKIYVREAEIYSKLGDEAAVNRVISEFKASPNYDEEAYAFTVGEGRDTPMTIVRPSAGSAGSISVSAMELSRSRARLAPGYPFPDFEAVDLQGRTIRLADYRGRVVLVDFWMSASVPWKQKLPYLASTYRKYNPQGFEIIGVNQERGAAGLDGFLKQNGITWPQIVNDPSVARRANVFGEATNFLLDRNGIIVGRDLSGGDLVAAIQQALAAQ